MATAAPPPNATTSANSVVVAAPTTVVITNGGTAAVAIPSATEMIVQNGQQPPNAGRAGVGAVQPARQQQTQQQQQQQQQQVVVLTNNKNTTTTTTIVPTIAHELRELIDEMRLRDFDSIRFATYRTACKLRFVQTKTSVHLVDIWNMIESFRENGLNAMASGGHLKISRLELLLTSVFHNLNKRLPASQQVDTDKSIATLLHFLLSAYDRQHVGRLTVFSIKVGLATLCAGKLVDKLRYIFSQISDTTGAFLDNQKFAEYLQQVLTLPTAVFEGPTFGYSQLALSQCFQRNPPEQVSLNQFLDTILGESCPPCLMWLPLLHRMASVENVYHPVVCDSCQVRSFTGFRYKCQRCTNYQLCQSCFWRGRVSQSHTNEHEMKEYSSYKSPTKQLAHTIQKSLQCVPISHQKTHKEFPTRPQRALDLANVVPSTPIVAAAFRRQVAEPVAEWTAQFLPGQYGCPSAMDDEHKLIARYAAKLAGRTVYAASSASNRRQQLLYATAAPPPNEQQQQQQLVLDERAMIARLEEENQQMLREMQTLEQQQALCDNSGQLNALRERIGELESRMREKQMMRRQLMEQLEQLMARLNASGTAAAMSSVAATPLPQSASVGSVHQASRARSTTSGGIPLGQLGMPSFSAQPMQQRLAAVSQLQGDLLQAADAIIENMSELVRELERDEEPSADETMENEFAAQRQQQQQHGTMRSSHSASKEHTPVTTASTRRS